MTENRVRQLLSERDVDKRPDIFVDPVLFVEGPPLSVQELRQLCETWLDDHCISPHDPPREDADVDRDDFS